LDESPEMEKEKPPEIMSFRGQEVFGKVFE